jgi:DNA-binding NarL/FixJ family response regulator
MKRIRLFVVDDHPLVRKGVESIFDCEADIEVVGPAAAAQDALERVPEFRVDVLFVDVLLTDLRIEGMSGDELVAQLHKTCPGVRAAVLTYFYSDEDVFRAMRAGVRAYLLKSATMEEVIAAVRRVYAGERWIPPHIAQQLADRVARDQLSSREVEVLQLIANGMKNREVADTLCISRHTVRNHVNNLPEKLNSRDRTETVTIALRQGLVRLHDEWTRSHWKRSQSRSENLDDSSLPRHASDFDGRAHRRSASHPTLQAQALLCLILSNTRTICPQW